MLNLNKINTQSPYLVWEQNGKYYFRTDYDKNDNPHLDIILKLFDEQVALFASNK